MRNSPATGPAPQAQPRAIDRRLRGHQAPIQKPTGPTFTPVALLLCAALLFSAAFIAFVPDTSSSARSHPAHTGSSSIGPESSTSHFPGLV